MAQSPQKQLELSPAAQQAVGKLNLRINDLLEALNQTIKVLLDENQALQEKLRELQAPVKSKSE